MSKISQEILDSDWYKTRPEIIKKAMEIWEFGDTYITPDGIIYLLGFSETEESEESNDPYDLQLIVTDIDPTENYERAMEHKKYICARHFRMEVKH